MDYVHGLDKWLSFLICSSTIFLNGLTFGLADYCVINPKPNGTELFKIENSAVKNDMDLCNMAVSKKADIYTESVAIATETDQTVKDKTDSSNSYKSRNFTSDDTEKHPVTIVTALLDLHREEWPYFQRPLEMYLQYAEQLLQLNVPMILFVDEKAESMIRSQRAEKMHITKLYVMNITDLDFYKEYGDRVTEIMNSENFLKDHALLKHPEGFSPEYNLLMNSKLNLLYKATVVNPFSSQYFYWFDIGYGHGHPDVFPKSGNWLPRNLMTYQNKIVYIELNPMKYITTIYDIYKRKLPPFLNGGFFGGSTKSVQEFYWLHKEMWELFLLHGMVDDDQTLAVLCYFAKPSLFKLVKGWWYDAFQLFN